MDIGNGPLDGDLTELLAVLTAEGFTATRRTYPRAVVQYSADQWIDFAFTHSAHLTLGADHAAELRARLADRIGSDGVSVGGESVAIIATPH
jgi:hypothetical protein